MFQPSIFHEERVPVMHELMRARPFATLVSSIGGALAADHLPFVLHDAGERGTLRGHLAAGNPLVESRDPAAALDVLAIFSGPQAYVTPSWYASKREHGKVVPTWNYVVVHARGRLRTIREPEWLLDHLRALTDMHESHRPVPWAVEDAPEGFVTRMLRGLVGVEIEIEALQGTWKVSQNKNEADRSGVADGLANASADMARLVGERA